MDELPAHRYMAFVSPRDLTTVWVLEEQGKEGIPLAHE